VVGGERPVQTRPTAAPDGDQSRGWPIVGHGTPVAALREAIARDRVRHAYLVSGPESVGKRTLALAFAAALVCQAPPAPGDSCGACLACRKVSRGVHPDVQLVDLATQALTAERTTGKNTTLTVETVRRVTADAARRPTESAWRIIVVDDVETMQGVAQEAFLKTLEEPPRFVVLILLCDDQELLLPTIRSRCESIELHRVGRPVLLDGLLVAGVEGSLAATIADQAGGLPGLAFRAAHDPKQLTIVRDGVERALTWIGANGYERLVTAVRLGDGFSRRRAETFAELEVLLGVWRDALLLRATLLSHLTYRGIAERLDALAAGWDLAEIHRAVRATLTCIADLEANVRPRLAIEAMVLQWPSRSLPATPPVPSSASGP
jgi:DNA polymerase-3 subunit delta'